MPLPSVGDFQTDAEAVGTDLAAVSVAIAGLPATPLEADLPDIVQIVADLSTAAAALQDVVSQILGVLSTTRISQ
jgi:predicted trehalose synthase